jgi:hypothetical protein
VSNFIVHHLPKGCFILGAHPHKKYFDFPFWKKRGLLGPQNKNNGQKFVTLRLFQTSQIVKGLSRGSRTRMGAASFIAKKGK